MAYQAAYYGLYGKSDCTYEPGKSLTHSRGSFFPRPTDHPFFLFAVMTKTFLHGRTESIRSVTETSKQFLDTFYSPTATSHEKLEALRKALKRHTALTRECAKGLGHDRHLYALECLWERTHKGEKKPLIFTDSGWKTMNHTVISTSNCGNPALRLFGFGPVVSDGFGIGYIIKEDGIAVSSKTHI